MTRTQRIVTAIGVALVVAGVAFIYWPAGLIVAGLAAVTAGLTDFKE